MLCPAGRRMDVRRRPPLSRLHFVLQELQVLVCVHSDALLEEPNHGDASAAHDAKAHGGGRVLTAVDEGNIFRVGHKPSVIAPVGLLVHLEDFFVCEEMNLAGRGILHFGQQVLGDGQPLLLHGRREEVSHSQNIRLVAQVVLHSSPDGGLTHSSLLGKAMHGGVGVGIDGMLQLVHKVVVPDFVHWRGTMGLSASRMVWRLTSSMVCFGSNTTIFA